MAFTGVAVITQVADGLVRITGLSLAKTVAGTIGFNGDGTAGVQLPAPFAHGVYSYGGGAVALGQDDVIDCWYVLSVAPVAAVIPPVITKGGVPFQITITNPDAANATGNLEIWVQYHR